MSVYRQYEGRPAARCGYALGAALTTSSSHFRAKGEASARVWRSSNGETAAHLVDHVIPQVPVRQWVLSLAIPLRLFLAAQPELITPVLQVVQRVLSRHLLEQASLKAGEGDCGSVTLIQPFSSDITCKQVSLRCHFVVARPPT
jgi:hypothetical protein